MGKPIDGKKLLEDTKNKVKQNQKEQNTMNKKHIIVTIVLTLAFLGSLASMFVLGINYERSINNRVNSEAKTLVSTVTPKK